MYIEYPSSQCQHLRLFADFLVPREPRLLLVQMHGWHGSVKATHTDNVAMTPDPEWFVIRPEMRGRGDSTGAPDCNGWELQDVVDAVEFARRTFAGKIIEPELVALAGGSGGGGNVYALLGKFPDFFCCARVNCGVSDYALWFRNDVAGEFRDEMEGAGWIGGNPDTRPEAYRSRSGVTTAGNLLVPLLIVHGETDERVPVEQARRFVAEAQRLGKGHLVKYIELPGVGGKTHWEHITPEHDALVKQTSDSFLRSHRTPAHLPRSGRFVVAGYLKTKMFEVVLDSLDHIATLDYDLDRDEFILTAPSARRAHVALRRNDGSFEHREIHIERQANPMAEAR